MYRCYFLDNAGHIIAVTTVECADDAHAERTCRAIFESSSKYHGVELWDRARHLSSCSRDDGANEMDPYADSARRARAPACEAD